MKRISTILIFLLVLVFVAVAFSWAAETKEANWPVKHNLGKKTIGWVTISLGYEGLKRCRNGFERVTNALGWRGLVSDAAGDPAKATAQIRAWVDMKVDGIITSAIAPQVISGGIAYAKSKGIPVINEISMDPLTWEEGGFWASVLYSPPWWVLQADIIQWGIERVGHQGGMAYIFMPNSIEGPQVQATVEAQLSQEPRMKLLKKHDLDTSNMAEDVYNMILGLCQAYPKPGQLVYIHLYTDTVAPAAVRALKEARREDIVLTGFNGDSYALELIRQGSTFKGTMAAAFEKMPWNSVGQLFRYWKGMPPTDMIPYNPVTATPTKLIHTGNIDRLGLKPGEVWIQEGDEDYESMYLNLWTKGIFDY